MRKPPPRFKGRPWGSLRVALWSMQALRLEYTLLQKFDTPETKAYLSRIARSSVEPSEGVRQRKPGTERMVSLYPVCRQSLYVLVQVPVT